MFFSAAAARAIDIEQPRIAFAPSLLLFSVPSSEIIRLSSSRWFKTDLFNNASFSTVFTLFIAVNTPFPLNRVLSLSRNSTASCAPVEAPDGTALRNTPLAVVISTSTVGFPRLSKISRACSQHNEPQHPTALQSSTTHYTYTTSQI